MVIEYFLFALCDSNSIYAPKVFPHLPLPLLDSLIPSFSVAQNLSYISVWLVLTFIYLHMNSPRASFLLPLLSASPPLSRRQEEGANISYKCSEEEKIQGILRCLLASCLWHHYSSVRAMLHAYDPSFARNNPSATSHQHAQKTTCLTANCLQGASQSLAIYVAGSDTVSLFNCLFSHQTLQLLTAFQ